ncbi:Uncharacterised protein [Plesiomonas shigelloides]|uniref:hypothetical protein n=1 Tax=Plesiomonas shigelloides TaxID=703 RepID=UPI000DFBE839|nr:hypothetical protein [Plesiomonas shigelloides]SUB62922.1 Uncharacterised protein [Plesiomonas shigelloides]
MYKVLMLIVVLGLCNKFFPTAVRLLPAAEIDYTALAHFENNPLHFSSYSKKFEMNLMACPKNKGEASELCVAKEGILYLNRLFYVNGHSYVKTMINYFDALINIKKRGVGMNMMNREQRITLRVFQEVSQYMAACMKHEPCMSWLKSKGYATTAQIQQLNEQFRVLK